MSYDVIAVLNNDDHRRIDSLDYFRGILACILAAMIILPPALREWGDGPLISFVQRHLQPSLWHGFAFPDVPQLAFIFVAGISVAISNGRRAKQSICKSATVSMQIRRCTFVFLLGSLLDGGLLCPFWPARLGGPLQQIALSTVGAGVIELYCGRRIALILGLAIAINYGYALEAFSDVPNYGQLTGAETLNAISFNDNFAARIERYILPGRKYFGDWDPHGLVATLPAIALCLFGVASASLLDNPDVLGKTNRRDLALCSWGLICICLGIIGTTWLPLNAWLNTPPIMSLIAGICLITLSGSGYFLLRLRSLSLTNVILFLGRHCLAFVVTLRLCDYCASRITDYAVHRGLAASFCYVRTICGLMTLTCVCGTFFVAARIRSWKKVPTKALETKTSLSCN